MKKLLILSGGEPLFIIAAKQINDEQLIINSQDFKNRLIQGIGEYYDLINEAVIISDLSETFNYPEVTRLCFSVQLDGVYTPFTMVYMPEY